MKAYKIGVLHCRKDQKTEEQIFNNTELTPDFSEFLDFLGETVELKGFEKFRGGFVYFFCFCFSLFGISSQQQKKKQFGCKK